MGQGKYCTTYQLDSIQKQSQLNEKGSKYSCNESVTLPDETSDEDTTHGIALETSRQNSTAVCTNLHMFLWILAAVQLDDRKHCSFDIIPHFLLRRVRVRIIRRQSSGRFNINEEISKSKFVQIDNSCS